MVTVASLVGAQGDPRDAADRELDALAVVVEFVILRREGERLAPLVARERQGGRVDRVVVAGGAILAGRGDRDRDGALRVGAERDPHGHLSALVDRVLGLFEVDFDGRVVVIANPDRGAALCSLRDLQRPREIGGIESNDHGFAVVVQGVLGRAEPDHLLGLVALEGDTGGHARVVQVRGLDLVGPGVGPGDRDHHLPLGVLVQPDYDPDARALGHGIGGLFEADHHVRVVVVFDGDGGGGPASDSRGHVAEAEQDRFAVVVHGVINGGDREAPLRVAGIEHQAGRHARSSRGRRRDRDRPAG